jgi:cAMP-dependent protein kinase regulator
MSNEYKDTSSNPKAERGCCGFTSFFGIFSSSSSNQQNSGDPVSTTASVKEGKTKDLTFNKSFSGEESEEENDLVLDLKKANPGEILKSGKTPRNSVSAEVYGAFNKKEAFVPREIKKSPETIERIRQRLLQSFLFSALEDKDIQTVLLAMEERTFNKGDFIIRQYEDGDNLYVLDSGALTCTRRQRKDDTQEVFVKNYQPGEAFGELALLYNAPRAATIICESENAVLFALDRQTFNHIVKDAAVKKRERYEGK